VAAAAAAWRGYPFFLGVIHLPNQPVPICRELRSSVMCDESVTPRAWTFPTIFFLDQKRFFLLLFFFGAETVFT
jgi:hypothetical protein